MGGVAGACTSFSRGGNARLRARNGGAARVRHHFILLAVVMLTVSLPAVAMTPAGTVISNVASVTYDGGSVTSNTATIVVSQMAAVQLSPESGSQTGFVGNTLYFPLLVSNAGNGQDTFSLAAASAAGWPVVIYRDDNADGLRQLTETTLITATRALAAGEAEACLIGVTLPASIVASDAVAVTVISNHDATCSAAASYIVLCIAQSAAGFSGSPTSGPAPLTVAFADQSTNAPTSWAWDFGDGQTSTLQTPSHAYQSAGSYTVSLTVANAGGENTIIKSGYIGVTAAPLSADFSASPKRGSVPLTVTFKDQSKGQPTAWRWDFGDGQQSAERNPVHVYRNQGMFNVTLQVSSGAVSARKTVPRCVITGKVKAGTPVLFADVSSSYWAYDEIQACIDHGVLSGFPDGTLRPDLPVSRDQITVYLSRALVGGDDQVPEGPTQPSFADVPTSDWAYRYVEYARDRKLVTGYADGLFHPTDAMNRGQMAVILARSIVDPTGEEGLGAYAPPAAPTFPDVTPDGEWSWCYKHVEYLASQGLVHGYPDRSYHPETVCTRDQLAVYVARAFGF